MAPWFLQQIEMRYHHKYAIKLCHLECMRFVTVTSYYFVAIICLVTFPKQTLMEIQKKILIIIMIPMFMIVMIISILYYYYYYYYYSTTNTTIITMIIIMMIMMIMIILIIRNDKTIH